MRRRRNENKVLLGTLMGNLWGSLRDGKGRQMKSR